MSTLYVYTLYILYIYIYIYLRVNTYLQYDSSIDPHPQHESSGPFLVPEVAGFLYGVTFVAPKTRGSNSTPRTLRRGG